MTQDHLSALFEQVASGALSPAQARTMLGDQFIEDIGFAQVDHLRSATQGHPEIVFGEGKTPDQVVEICKSLHRVSGGFLVTRIDAATRAALTEHFPQVEFNELGRTAYLAKQDANPSGRGTILIATAGTSDLPVAEEAAVVAAAMGNVVERLTDVGVAGIHRVLRRADVLREAAVVIVVAGMDGALASVIGGMISRPVVAVPTSVGYGASFGGVSALLAMLNSCAAGVTVVNIDGGFSAAAAASRINHLP